MQFPIQLTFKLLAIASQIYIRDANGQLVGYVKQKLFKLKEEINVFADEAQSQLRFSIKADRVLDLSAKYNFSRNSGEQIGSIKRHGMRSLWRANYEVFDSLGHGKFRISEANGWIKVVDALAGEIPVLGMFSGYFFNPAYEFTELTGTAVARLQKRPAFFEGVFELSQHATLSESDEELILLAALTMTLLERARG